MPTYSVIMQDRKPALAGWEHLVLRVKASSRKAAMKKAAREFFPSLIPERAVKVVSEQDRTHWQRIWLRAYHNMPVHLKRRTHTFWEKQASGTVTVPQFIKGQARGTMRMVDNDTIVEKHVKIVKTWRSNKHSNLSRLLNYKQRTKWGMNVSVQRGMAYGTCPREKSKRALLIQLASKRGQHLALKLLSARFENGEQQ
jgi:hypothetical protein